MTSGADWQVAQVNIALPLEPLSSARVVDLIDRHEPVSALAEPDSARMCPA
jgi:hypothetical protein